MFFWDNVLVEECGFKRENITTYQILHKPWLFRKQGVDGMFHTQGPDLGEVEGCPPLDPADEEEYTAAVDATRVARQLLVEGKPVPPPPNAPSGLNYADVLAKKSLKLYDKYPQAFDAWCETLFDEVDIVCGYLSYSFSDFFASTSA